ncbi:hypothetical protein [Cytobacillus massiliigabonensis]|uniref:hypothetical protein n=1 Tax=Cytobacillus massiliigabonensis TaxID=1871011 RepID=UPI000C831B24|nr:hypothetical protein [Cytobacillus massiliigabonensis]
MNKKWFVALAFLVCSILLTTTASAANTIIDQSTVTLGPGESLKYTRVINVPDGAYLGVYFDDKTDGAYGNEYFLVKSVNTNDIVTFGKEDFNRVMGVPAGSYVMMLECYDPNLSCSATGSLSAQYKN